MEEKEPLYFKEFREYIEKRFDGLEKDISDLALSTSERFDEVTEEMVALYDTVERIEGHIGRYEIRSTYIEDTFIKNHGRRISELEQAYLNS